MTLRALLLALALTACASSARVDDPMAPFAPLIGCWRGAFDNAPNIHDERCFERLGAHVVDRHAVRPTDYSGETTYHYDDVANEVVFAYSASDGGRSNGVMRASPGALEFPPHTYVGANGERQRLRSTWRIENPDRFVAISEREEGGAWRPWGRITYTRAAD